MLKNPNILQKLKLRKSNFSKNNFSILGETPPVSIDNSSLLITKRPLQHGLANCMILSICNIVEALHWQKTGIEIQFDYNSLFEKIDNDNIGISFASINKILKKIKAKTTFKLNKSQIRNSEEFKKVLKSTIHNKQFATVASKPILDFWQSYHAVTICGYDFDNIIFQSTYSHQPRFMKLEFDILYQKFEIIHCVGLL